MKINDFKTLGMEELTIQEQYATEGGSITIFLVCAAAALLLSSCMSCSTGQYEPYLGPINNNDSPEDYFDK